MVNPQQDDHRECGRFYLKYQDRNKELLFQRHMMEIVILQARIAVLKRLIVALKLQQSTTSTRVSGRV
jgi:hypothetical protein